MELQGAKAYVLRQSAPFVTEHVPAAGAGHDLDLRDGG
jgi:hypothetical protein